MGSDSTEPGGAGGLDAGNNTNSFYVFRAYVATQRQHPLCRQQYRQTICDLGCTAVSPLTSASTVQQTRDHAKSLIGNAKSGFVRCYAVPGRSDEHVARLHEPGELTASVPTDRTGWGPQGPIFMFSAELLDRDSGAGLVFPAASNATSA